MSFTVYNPVKLFFGCGQLQKIGDCIRIYGKRILLVTNPWYNSRGKLFDYAQVYLVTKEALEAQGFFVKVFDHVQPNPDVLDIDEGSEIARNADVEFVIGFGGGSAIDTAKAIAFGVTAPKSLWEHCFIQNQKPSSKTLPIVAITTTSGTGSFMTNIAVISNRKTAEKLPVVSEFLFPRVAICDPELMLTLPQRSTIEMGFDVFSHAFEAYTSRESNPLIDPIALEAINLVIHNLIPLSQDLSNIRLRRVLALADCFAGICISNVGTTVPHAMGLPITAKYDKISHGSSLLFVFSSFIKHSAEGAAMKFITIGKFFDPNVSVLKDAVNLTCLWIIKLRQIISLQELKINENDLDELWHKCLKLPKWKMGPKDLTEEQIRQMFSESLIIESKK